MFAWEVSASIAWASAQGPGQAIEAQRRDPPPGERLCELGMDQGLEHADHDLAWAKA